MDISYGVGTRNRYELFYDNDADPMEMIKKPKKKAKNSEKENKVQTTKTKENTVKNSVETKQPTKVQITEPTKPEQKQNNDARKFGDREERNNRQNKFEHGVEKSEPKQNGMIRSDDSKPRGGRTGGFGRGRGGYGAGRGEFRGKREFDRRSGMPNSGVKPHDKRRGGGSHNWGSDKDQIETVTKTEEKAQNSSEETTEDVPEVKENEEPKEMTLDEWKAMQKRSKPQFNVRKAGEGENNEQWKDATVLKKKEPAPVVEEEINDTAQVTKKKTHVPIDFRFADSRTNKRRGRPNKPGYGGKFHGRNEMWQQAAPQMDNEQDFPSLG